MKVIQVHFSFFSLFKYNILLQCNGLQINFPIISKSGHSFPKANLIIQNLFKQASIISLYFTQNGSD